MDSSTKTILILLVSGVAAFRPAISDAQNIPAERTIRVKLDQEVTTKLAVGGDTISARLVRPLNDGDDIVAPEGSRFQGRVDFVQQKSTSDDGWMRLLFNQLTLPDGREIQATALASFYKSPPHPKRDHVLFITGFAAIGWLLGGRNERVTAGLGGAIAGLVLAENKHSTGQDLTLRAGQSISVRLSESNFGAKSKTSR